MTPKNYYIYFANGKIRRETIRKYEIYPESYALDRISVKFPEHDTVVRIETGKENISRGIWQKHALYPGNWEEDGIMEKWKENQKIWQDKYFPMLNDKEKLLLER
jgi:hypothetical protein